MTALPPAARPDAVLVGGPPASGKSTLGALVAGHLGAVLIDQDTATGPLVSVVDRLLGTGGNPDDPRLVEAVRAQRGTTVIDLAVDNLRIGNRVVCVAPWSREVVDTTAWTELIAPLEAAGADVHLVWMRCDIDEVLARMRARGEPRDAAKLADSTALADRIHRTVPVVPHHAVDATLPTALAAAAVLDKLDDDSGASDAGS